MRRERDRRALRHDISRGRRDRARDRADGDGLASARASRPRDRARSDAGEAAEHCGILARSEVFAPSHEDRSGCSE